MRSLLLACLLLVLLCPHPSALADDRPRDRNLVLAGMAIGVPTYALGVAVHEGTHALAAKAMGAKVTDYSLIPGLHPRTGRFYFGYVSVVGLRTQKQRAFFLMAPKLTDTLVLGGFSLLYATDSLPSNHYGQTAVLVLATGFWVDFSKDILSFSDGNDTMKFYKILGIDSELGRLPARLVHLGLSAAMGYAIVRGTEDLFEREGGMTQPLILPMWDRAF